MPKESDPGSRTPKYTTRFGLAELSVTYIWNDLSADLSVAIQIVDNAKRWLKAYFKSHVERFYHLRQFNHICRSLFQQVITPVCTL